MTKDEKLEMLNKTKYMFIKLIDEMIQDVDDVDDDTIIELYKELKGICIISKIFKEINEEEENAKSNN